MTSASDDGIRVLRELGLNQLEAEVYTHVLPREPMTAYRIAQELGRPTANVYKAVEALARLGAVLVEEGANRNVRAVSTQEFLRNRERAYAAKTREAEQLLSAVQRDRFDERVYRIESVPEVLRRARAMIEQSSDIVVVDAFPNALEQLRETLEAAASRGVRIAVEAYAPIEINGCEVTVVPDGEMSVAAWRSEQLNLVTDGCEVLITLLSADLTRVFQALWSPSVYLSCIVHAGMLSEQTVLKLLNASARWPANEELGEILAGHPFFRNSTVPGHRELLARYVRDDEPESGR